MPTLHTFAYADKHFSVSDDSAPAAVIAAEARVAHLGDGCFVQVARDSYVWRSAAGDDGEPRTDRGEALRTSRLTWDRGSTTLSGSGSALARSARYESLRVMSSQTGKLKTFAWSHDECGPGGEVLAWVYRSHCGTTLRVVND